jgi:nucleolar protein 56
LKSQVEERLKFFESGATPEKNAEVMKRVIDSLGDLADEDETAVEEESTPVKATKKRAAEDDATEEDKPAKKTKKDKKEKKDKKDKKEKKEKKEKKNKD